MIENKLAEIIEEYKSSLPSRASAIEGLVQAKIHELGTGIKVRGEDWDELHLVAHRFCGSAGTYGFKAISKHIAILKSDLENKAFTKLPNKEISRYLQNWVFRFAELIEEALPPKKESA